MSIGNFDACLKFTLVQEGGYSNTPGDHGGPTKFGIDLATLIAWREQRCTAMDMYNLTEDEAGQIYMKQFWLPVGGNALPVGIDLMLFDFGVNVGPTTSVITMQRELGLVADGDVGPITSAKIAAQSPTALIASLYESQAIYYERLSEFSEFGKGWIARCDRRRDAALSMLRASTMASSPAQATDESKLAKSWPQTGQAQTST